MQKIWIGLFGLSALSLAACGGSDGRSTSGPTAQVQSYTKACLQKPAGTLDIKGFIWTMPFSDEQVTGLASWQFDDETVAMSAACTSKSDKTSATVNLKTKITLAPSQVQLLESKSDEKPVTGGVCRLTTTPMNLSYSFQGSCLRVTYPTGDNLIFTPQALPSPSPVTGTGTTNPTTGNPPPTTTNPAPVPNPPAAGVNPNPAPEPSHL